MLLGYNTNGLAGIELLEAIDLLARIGYRGVAITLDQRVLNPFDDGLPLQLQQTAAALERYSMRSVIETGARFLLDPRTKHEPTLVSADPAGRARRVDFLRRAIDVAAHLHADCVSLWSGAVRDLAPGRVVADRLVEGLGEVLEHGERRNVVVAFEPEPDMLVATLEQYSGLLVDLEDRQIDSSRLKLTLDIGHLHCQDELPIPEKIREWGGRLVNVHIEDMRRGVHEHRMFGEGEILFPPVIAALADIGYDGLLNVELTRHSPEGPAAARRAYNFLSPLVEGARRANRDA